MRKIALDIETTGLNPLDGHKIIEIGCGAGNFINILSKKIKNCNNFIGIDINKKQIKKNIEKYQGNKNVDFVYADIEDYISKGKMGDNILFTFV